MSWLHRRMLRALPKAHRDRYGDDIARVFDEQRRASRWRDRPALWAREVHAILAIAARSRRPAPFAAPPGDRRWAGWQQDIEHAARSLTRAPGHALTVIGCLGVGIAITLAAFAVVSTVLYGELPGISERRSLSRLYISQNVSGGTINISRFRPAEFEVLRHHGPAIRSIGAQSAQFFPVRVHAEMTTVSGAFVSGGYFDTLGSEPVLGRLLTQADDDRAADTAVIGDRLWRTYFNGAPSVLGQVITVAGRDLQIVGVMAPAFFGLESTALSSALSPPQLWVPLSLARSWPGIENNGALVAIAVRHAPGVTRAAVGADLSASVARLSWRAATANPQPLGQKATQSSRDVAKLFGLCLAIPLSLFAIGCANVANLQLARALDRTRELSVRLSLGASRWRVMRLLAIEATMLTGAAVVTAWFAGRAILQGLFALVPFPVHADPSVFWAAASLALVVVGACGIAPGWLVASRLDLGALKQTPQSGARPHARLRHLLVGLQISISFALLVLSGLATRTLVATMTGVPAIAREVLVATVDVGQSGLDPRSTARLALALADALERDARVQAVGISSMDRREFRYLRFGDDAQARQFARVTYVTPGYFPSKGVAAAAGRTLTPRDRGTPAAVVSQSLARALEREGVPALGQRIRLEALASSAVESQLVEIVGVVPDPYRLPIGSMAPLDIYRPLGETLPPTFTLSARSPTPSALVPTLRQALETLEPRAAQMDAGTLVDGLRRLLGPFVYVTAIAGAIGTLALLLAAAGLYAVVAYVVSLRTREFGVRLAVGAAPRDITRLVVIQAARIVGAGAAAGILITVPIAISLRKIFVGISPLDPWAFLPMLAVLAAAAALASFVPARRAARIDPVVALRAE